MNEHRPDTMTVDLLAERKMRFLFALRTRGVMDKRVLEAMERVDRGDFVRGHFKDRAYDDVPLPIACGQTISQPSIVALMTEALEIGPRDFVLEVGTGSGYQTAVLSLLARRVYTVDRQRRLVHEAETLFRSLGLHNIVCRWGDGTLGLRQDRPERTSTIMPLGSPREQQMFAPFGEQAPFDRIIVTAAAEDPPPTLLEQLRIGGIMVLPVGQSDTVQQLVRVRRLEHGFEYEELRPVRFVPLVEGVENE